MASERALPGPNAALSVLGSADFIDELHRRWENDPASVSEEWRLFFTGFDLAKCPRDCVAAARARSQSSVSSLIYAYRSIGHLIADVNPLHERPQTLPELELEQFGLADSDLDQVYDTGHLAGPGRARLRDILATLEETYCRSVGVEYVHIQDRNVRRWLQQEMEPIRNRPPVERSQRLEILKQLIDAELFETFLQTRYLGQKRFSLEGAEALIPALHAFLRTAAEEGIEEVVVGMAHRGRLNVLANILHKPYQMIFHEFEDDLPEQVWGGGDVKYHRGYSSVYEIGGASVQISLTANPSHLEAVNPVVLGRTRAKQRRRQDTDRRERVVSLLLHGDAAFSGQGLVAETFNLSQLKGYRTGGTVHIVINNQIGFTTTPDEARSSRYPTDVAKMVEAPIFHVNGDDPEALAYVVGLALRFRQHWGRDVVIDMICYRRHGHNEGDEPAFTQPVLYRKIEQRPTVRTLYQQQLEQSGELSPAESAELREDFQARLQNAFETVQISCPVPEEASYAFSGIWKGLDNPYSWEPAATTGVARDRLLEVTRALTTVPDGFSLNPKVGRRLPAFLEAVEEHGTVDWGMAELLAIGSLLDEGLPVRLSGQDSIRGTFSHRHAAWFDRTSGEMYIPLAHIRNDQARFCAYNSMLSEPAVLGFDYGYSLVEPNMLVIWEAQFGDFANGAQVIIDQFIAASLAKWGRASGLVMLLPHGYEGQGPEHSNAYLERYLSLCAEDNVQVCNFTTPAQYFHALRRQLKRGFRRPLIVMSPKSLLRHKLAVSPVEELVKGSFHEVLDDPEPPADARRLLLCSGKVFYDLVEARRRDGVDDVAIIRVEQLYPFHHELLRTIIEPYQGAEDVVWVQEEPQNRGAWSFIRPHLESCLQGRSLRNSSRKNSSRKNASLRYAGREPSASPATGSARIHRRQQDALVHAALHGEESA